MTCQASEITITTVIIWLRITVYEISKQYPNSHPFTFHSQVPVAYELQWFSLVSIFHINT